MKIKDFKSHIIKRSTPKPRKNYRDYRAILQKDFQHRCAYCNLCDTSITTPFEIDHFVPKKECEKVGRTDLIADYRNLIYACKKCNSAKRVQFKGDMSADIPTNELFYDPVVMDYNSVFYRNECGTIEAITEKGKDQIKRLKLFRPIHALAWICEETDKLVERLKTEYDSETKEHRKQLLADARDKASLQYHKFNRVFLAAYNDSEYKLKSE